MQGQQSLFHSQTRREFFQFRIDDDTKTRAIDKANQDGYKLSYLVKCFICGYLSGQITADIIVGFANKDK